MPVLEIRVPKFPACSEPCGACQPGEAMVVEVPVAPGDRVEADAVVAVVETNKTTIEVPAPHAGVVASVFVAANETVREGAVLLTLRED